MSQRMTRFRTCCSAVQDVRLRFDATDPTASVGFLLRAVDAPAFLPVTSASQMRVIETAASATLDYQFFSK